MIYFLAYTAIGLGLALYYRIKEGAPKTSNVYYISMFAFLWPIILIDYARTNDL